MKPQTPRRPYGDGFDRLGIAAERRQFVEWWNSRPGR